MGWSLLMRGGATDDPAVDQLRRQQIKNFLVALFVSQGRPMMLMGDEVRRTQLGNNNAYCQDNEMSWYDWDLATREAGLLRFVREFLNFRKGSFLFTDRNFWGEPGSAKVTWHGVDLGRPDFSDDSHTLALELSHLGSAEHLYGVFNAYWESLDFTLPDLPGGQIWHRLVDTALRSPQVPDPPRALRQGQDRYAVAARSTVVLIAGQQSPASARVTGPEGESR